VLLAVHLVASVFISWRAALIVCCFAMVVCATARVVFVVNRNGAWVDYRVLGVRWKRFVLGRRPKVSVGFGLDWDELAVVPDDPALRPALHDGERAVLAEWSDDNESKRFDAEIIAELANDAIARLHGA
jgi:hypothetical protein